MKANKNTTDRLKFSHEDIATWQLYMK